MFRKVELWIVLLIVLLSIIFSIFFGALVKHYTLGGQILNPLKKVVLFLSDVPFNLIKMDEDVSAVKNLPFINFDKNHNKKKFQQFSNNLDRNELLIISRYDGDIKSGIIEIVDLNKFKKLHEYKLKDKKIKSFSKNFKGEFNPETFHYHNPLVLQDGSVVFSAKNILFKLDLCSNILWMNDKENSHHSNNVDYENNIWSVGDLMPYSRIVQNYRKYIPDFKDNALIKTDINGKTIYKKSITEILYNNNFNVITSSNDPLHVNDIEPALSDGRYWKKGDLFISVHQLSSIIHYRPSSDEILNIIKGPFTLQHDVDIISDHEISIFNNNYLGQIPKDVNGKLFSNIVIYNFEDKTFRYKFKKEFKENNIFSPSNGLIENFNDGAVLVEETVFGRLILLDKNGKVEWEYVNKDKSGDSYIFSWSRLISNEEKAKTLKKLISQKKCP